MQYCTLQHRTSLSPPDTSTNEHCFHFGPVTSFFLELSVIVLYSYPRAYWTLSDLRRSSPGLISFCLFMLLMEQWTIQRGKRIFQCYILSCYLFNLKEKYIMQNVKLNESQAGIKSARRNTSNLRYSDNTSLMAERE